MDVPFTKAIAKEIREAEADGFKRGRREGLEEAAIEVNTVAKRYDDPANFARANTPLIRAVNEAEKAIRALLERPDG